MQLSKKLVILLLAGILFISCKSTDVKEKIPYEVIYRQNFQVISPNNDGKQDELNLEVNFKSPNFIKYYRFEVLDENKNLVKSSGTQQSLEELQKSFYLKKENIELPKNVIWDGKDINGKVVENGKYYFRFIVMDDKKNVLDTAAVKIGTVYVNTAKPEAEITSENLIFSPNDDGVKDTFIITINVKYSELEKKYPEIKGKDWNIDILDNQDKLLKNFKLNDKSENVFKVEWDGTDSQGKKLSDGIYKAKIYSTDSGANYQEYDIKNIVIDNFQEPVEISMNEGVFSPNADGVKDTIRFNIAIKDKKNIDQWQFSVYKSGETNNIIQQINGTKTINDFIDWDGKNDAGGVEPEGEYYGILEVKFISGNTSKATSSSFNIDIIPPQADITLPYAVFSPDGNNLKDSAIINQKTSNEKTEWEASITDLKNQIIKKYSWKNEVPAELKWDGFNEDGKLSGDGDYFYSLKCTDIAGNKFESPRKKITIFTKTTPVSIVLQAGIFSPGKSGAAGSAVYHISAEASENNPATDWTITIKDMNNNIISEEKKTEKLPFDYIWNGMADQGKAFSDGKYIAAVKVNFFYGTTTLQTADPVTIDQTGPDIEIGRNISLFSPDNDGIDDQFIFTFKDAKDISGIKNWKLEILSPFSKKEFMSFSGDGVPKGSITWDGKSKNGNLVESVQEYPVKIIAEDNLGNISEKSLDPILIDILVFKLDDGRYKIRISNINFLPDSAVMTKNEKNHDILTKLTNALKKFPDYSITIEGYANEYRKGLNVKWAETLSKNRAVTVADELQKRGIKKERLKTVGKGFENPIIALRPNMTLEELEEMAVNRRVEFYLSR